MRYSADVESNFIDRPHQTIRHCMLQKSIGEKMNQTGIRMTDVGKFTIQYFKNNMKKIHYLDFGNDYKMPSCSCYTWKKSAYPCKHFFAVFQKFAAWNWDALSGLYKNSPYLNLDDFDSSIQTGDFLQNNCAVIKDYTMIARLFKQKLVRMKAYRKHQAKRNTKETWVNLAEAC